MIFFSNIGINEDYDKYKWLIKDWYPFVRNDLENVIEKYKVDTLVVDKISVKNLSIALGSSYYDFTKFKIIYENNLYTIYKTKH